MQHIKLNIKENKTWKVNTHSKCHTTNLKYLWTKYTTGRGGEHRPSE